MDETGNVSAIMLECWACVGEDYYNQDALRQQMRPFSLRSWISEWRSVHPQLFYLNITLKPWHASHETQVMSFGNKDEGLKVNTHFDSVLSFLNLNFPCVWNVLHKHCRPAITGYTSLPENTRITRLNLFLGLCLRSILKPVVTVYLFI